MTDKSRRELELTEDDVWSEHLQEVNATNHWLYLWSVLIGGTLLMIGLIAWLGANGA